MKIVILHNVDMNNFSTEDELYLSGGRVTYAITNKINHALMEDSSKNRKNVVFLMWNDRIYDKNAGTWDENLSPSPIDRVCDFVSDVLFMHNLPKFEIEHVCNLIKYMRSCDTLHYDVLNRSFNVM